MASSLAAKAPALAARSVHLKLFPTPRTFNDRRQVLRVLERFGEVTMFKSFKYRALSPVHNAFIATFADENSVAELRKAAPIRYVLMPPTSPTDEDPDVQTTATMVSPEASTTSREETTAQESEYSPLAAADESTDQIVDDPQEHDQSTFHLEVYPSNLQHDRYITSPHTNPLYGPFSPLTGSKSLIAGMLKDGILSSMGARGLRDWETDAERWRIAGVADRQAAGDDSGRLKSEVLGRVSSWGEGIWLDDSEPGSAVPTAGRAAYTRDVNRRRKAIPSIMWGVKHFQENGRLGKLD